MFEKVVEGGGVLTQDFGLTSWALSCRCEWTCPGYPPGAFHAGIDIAAGYGTRLLAVGYGTVARIGRGCPGCGCDGLGPFAVCVNSGPVDIWYGHAYEALVSVGDQVQPGTPLSLMDSVGCSTGNHVHFEVLPAGSDPNGCAAINPWAYTMAWPGVGVPAPPPPPAPPPVPPGPPPYQVSTTDAFLLLAGGAALLLAAGRR